MNRLIAACLLPAVLSGCGLQLASGLGQQVPGIVGGLDTAVNSVILQKAMDLHNLQVGLAQIQSSPGMVVSVMPPPVIGTTNPSSPVPIMPAPNPPMPPVSGTPTPVGLPPLAPPNPVPVVP